jgi:chloride channel protein, CIC family
VVEHRAAEGAASSLASVVRGKPVVASPDEPLRVIVHRMAETGITRFPVVERHSQKLIGMVSLTDLLKARTLNLDAEQRCERVLGAKITSAFGRARKTA